MASVLLLAVSVLSVLKGIKIHILVGAQVPTAYRFVWKCMHLTH